MNFGRTWEQILIFRYTFHHTFESIEKLKNILFSLIKVSPSIFISFHFFKCEKNPKVNFDVSEYFVVKGFPCFNDFFFFYITTTIENNEFLLIKVPNFFQQWKKHWWIFHASKNVNCKKFRFFFKLPLFNTTLFKR